MREPRTALSRDSVSGFMVMRLVSRLSLANHLAWSRVGDLGPFLTARASLSLDEFQREGFWEVGGTYHLLPHPFGPSLFLLARLRGSTAVFIRASCAGPRKQVTLRLAKAGGLRHGFPNKCFRHHFFV